MREYYLYTLPGNKQKGLEGRGQGIQTEPIIICEPRDFKAQSQV